jgi:hypothetical protein
MKHQLSKPSDGRIHGATQWNFRDAPSLRRKKAREKLANFTTLLEK